MKIIKKTTSHPEMLTPTLDAGELPQWNIADLPPPPPLTVGNVWRTIGPGAILLAASIGGGEWLIAPAAAVRFGSQIMWIATIAITLQLIVNLEAIRYTLYTGEPIYGGILRLRPGRKVWGGLYCAMTFLSLGWPATAGASAAILFSGFAGHIPTHGDSESLYWLTVGVILVVVLLLSMGGTIERGLEIFSWVMILLIFTFLLVSNLAFVPWNIWLQTLKGFSLVSGVRGEIDWSLMASLAATAGAGGIANLSITNWIRDKGFGMGKLVGAIPSAIGKTSALKLSHVGTVFPITKENLDSWRAWLTYVHLDQILVFAVLAFGGMFLNVNLAIAVIPQGADISGVAAGAYQARYLAEHIWPGFWMLTLLNGFWILFSTQIGDTDLFVRTITDIVWMSSDKLRNLKNYNVSTIYYSLLAGFTLWAFIAVRLAPPFVLFSIMANVSGFILMFSSIQILRINRRFLPRELRPPRWRQGALVGCAIFYGFFSFRWIHEFLGEYF